MTQPTLPSPTPGAAPGAVAPDAAGRLARYRVMAWITGTMLLVLCLELVLKYVLHAGGYDAQGHPEPVLGTWVAIAHGWVYVVYLATVVQLWSAMRWSLGRLAAMALAGVVPAMSFVLERRVHAQAVAQIGAQIGAQGGAQGGEQSGARASAAAGDPPGSD